jgi:multiple antibiotic resistance protein
MTEKFLRDALMLGATIDPLGTLALFVAVTRNLPPESKRSAALKAVIYSGAILIASVIVGQVILTAMHIRLLSLQVAGGLILFLLGLKMVFGGHFETQPEAGHDVAVFPLAVPAIANPGSIMACVLLTDNNVYPIATQMGTTAILIGILALTYVLLRLSGPIHRFTGVTGAAILTRVMGMILCALSVELVMGAVGAEAWLRHSAALPWFPPR